MELILQNPHPKACVLACIAMIEEMTLEKIIEITGEKGHLSYEAKQRLNEYFDREEFYTDRSWPIRNYSEHSIGHLMKDYTTLLCTVSSCLDVNFAHAVLIHERHLYDPHAGMNPTWPWDRSISRASIIR